MAVFRIIKTKDYSVMSNYHFREVKMSLKAIGMLSLMLSLPDDWDYSVEGLTSMRCETKNTINNVLKELEEFGYLKRTKIRNEKGIYENCIYDIYEKPYTKNRDMEKRDMENPYMDNSPQLNTKELNIKKSNTNKYFIKPTLEEVKQYCEERGNGIDAEYFIDFYESKGWNIGKTKMKDWKATIRTWERNKKQQLENKPKTKREQMNELFERMMKEDD